jgi:hypothetical protein
MKPSAWLVWLCTGSMACGADDREHLDLVEPVSHWLPVRTTPRPPRSGETPSTAARGPMARSFVLSPANRYRFARAVTRPKFRRRSRFPDGRPRSGSVA